MATSVGQSSLDNDTRGWIMCVVSGIGELLLISKNPMRLRGTILTTIPSLRCWRLHSMR
jgi:hypothetical protein